MPRGASAKRERQFKKIEQKLEEEGRYKGREEEVAARIRNGSGGISVSGWRRRDLRQRSDCPYSRGFVIRENLILHQP